MDILLISKNDTCRSRIAKELLSSFGRGAKIVTAGIQPGGGVPDVVIGVMEQKGYDLSCKKAADVEDYCHRPWDYVVTLCDEAEEARGDFDKEVKQWKHFSFADPLVNFPRDESGQEQRISELYEKMYKVLYEFYRDELSEQLLPRCTCGANTYCRCE